MHVCATFIEELAAQPRTAQRNPSEKKQTRLKGFLNRPLSLERRSPRARTLENLHPVRAEHRESGAHHKPWKLHKGLDKIKGYFRDVHSSYSYGLTDATLFWPTSCSSITWEILKRITRQIRSCWPVADLPAPLDLDIWPAAGGLFALSLARPAGRPPWFSSSWPLVPAPAPRSQAAPVDIPLWCHRWLGLRAPGPLYLPCP